LEKHLAGNLTCLHSTKGHQAAQQEAWQETPGYTGRLRGKPDATRTQQSHGAGQQLVGHGLNSDVLALPLSIRQ